MKIFKKGEPSTKIHGHIITNKESMKPNEEAEKNLAGWKRAMADYENLHRRINEENQKARANGTEEALRSMLPVLDYFDAAFSAIPEDIGSHEWVIGMTNIQKAFINALQTQGVEPIDQVSVPFDPHIHEAVEHVKDETNPAGTILTVVSRGYRMGNKILRPAKVKVSDNPETNEQNPSPPSLNKGRNDATDASNETH